MPRNVLPESRIRPAALEKIGRYHADFLKEIEAAIAANEVVVIGMRINPFPRKARRLLDQAGIPYKYLGYGSYLSEWRKRLAIKLWTGWPTFPQIFVRGVLIGGANDLEKLLASGELSKKA